MHIAFLHPDLAVTSGTERLIATVKAAVAEGARVSLLTRRGPRALALEAAGAQILEAELPTEPALGIFAQRRTASLLKELAPDLLHTTDGSLAPLTARLAERVARPYMVEVMRPVLNSSLSATKWLQTILVPCETFIEGAVNRAGASRQTLEVLPHAPDLERSWSPRSLSEVERPVVATLGTLDEFHGTLVFLEAARRMKRAGRKLTYLVLGEGSAEMDLRRRVRELDLGEDVIIAAPSMPAGGQGLAEIDLHVSCVTSGSPGWCAVQALGLGIPSVFSAVNCTFALIEDKNNGLLVERNRPEKLAEQLDVFLDNPRAARRMGAVARQSMRQRELAEPFAKRLTELWDRALAGAKS